MSKVFSIYYRAEDQHSPLNGVHASVASGAEFIAAYPEADGEAGDLADCARHVDEMPIGETSRFWTWDGDIDITRES